MMILVNNCNFFTLEILEELFEKCNVTYVIEDGYITDIGYRFGWFPAGL